MNHTISFLQKLQQSLVKVDLGETNIGNHEQIQTLVPNVRHVHVAFDEEQVL